MGKINHITDFDLVLRPSKIGKSVFANRIFRAGEKVMDIRGALLQGDQLPIPYDQVEDHYVQVGKDLYLGPSGGLDDFVNHSCNPNTGFKFGEKAITLIAIREIKPQEEVTWDYSTTMHEDDWEMNCSCDSANCRKVVRDFVYLPKKIQQKYINLRIVPDYILKDLNKKYPLKRGK